MLKSIGSETDTLLETEVDGMEVSALLNKNTILPQNKTLRGKISQTGAGTHRSSYTALKPELLWKSSTEKDSGTNVLNNNTYVHYNRNESFPPKVGAGFSCIFGMGTAAAAELRCSKDQTGNTQGGGEAVR